MIEITMQECHISFTPRDDGGKIMRVVDPASTLTVVLPINPDGCGAIAEFVSMPNEELQAKIDGANAASRIAIADATELGKLNLPE